ncbi:hypothetical protein D3C73_1529960 [compost metagenome]
MQRPKIAFMNRDLLLKIIHGDTSPCHIGQPGLDLDALKLGGCPCGQKQRDHSVAGT